ncbi:hypothetical protein P8891_06290 [Bacillus atrophaeus]|uniref:hypothetical protein n=1 Tax=Bacillus atrophaeus TaxID=1452 RepID=UPI0022807410|nr:hypothetical protein [Bacillus atrophaeus]MCY7948011.1 hypothetical protein [Bacillus atrophaeus]MCY8098044.1 hypothetical protein [Bacillus atrophaeus]MCY9169968.1 hypothetical protein [Bacillus atrophaeus]MEC0740693.1 hypothetical protein [Bacillus atrophaeus]MEC0747043.1 hypothetical protein [Bacillus atrophaeus]
MWFIKREYIKEVNDSKNFDDALKTIKKLIKEEKGFSVPLNSGKTNMALHYHLKAIKEGYEFIHFNIG